MTSDRIREAARLVSTVVFSVPVDGLGEADDVYIVTRQFMDLLAAIADDDYAIPHRTRDAALALADIIIDGDEETRI